MRLVLRVLGAEGRDDRRHARRRTRAEARRWRRSAARPAATSPRPSDRRGRSPADPSRCRGCVPAPADRHCASACRRAASRGPARQARARSRSARAAVARPARSCPGPRVERGEERSLVVGQHAAMMAPAANRPATRRPPTARTLVFDVTSTASAAGRRCRDRAADRGAGHRTTRPCAGAVRPADRVRRAHPGGHLDGRAIGRGDGHARSDRRPPPRAQPAHQRDRRSARDRKPTTGIRRVPAPRQRRPDDGPAPQRGAVDRGPGAGPDGRPDGRRGDPRLRRWRARLAARAPAGGLLRGGARRGRGDARRVRHGGRRVHRLGRYRRRAGRPGRARRRARRGADRQHGADAFGHALETTTCPA